MTRQWSLLVPGFILGVGLGISGMTNPGKVVGFLDIAGAWDPSLAFVMAGAIGTFTVLNRLVHYRDAAVLGGSLPGPRAKGVIDGRLVVGAALFGIGWGLGGICPGPAIANLARLLPEGALFVAMMSVGMIVAQKGLRADV